MCCSEIFHLQNIYVSWHCKSCFHRAMSVDLLVDIASHGVCVHRAMSVDLMRWLQLRRWQIIRAVTTVSSTTSSRHCTGRRWPVPVVITIATPSTRFSRCHYPYRTRSVTSLTCPCPPLWNTRRHAEKCYDEFRSRLRRQCVRPTTNDFWQDKTCKRCSKIFYTYICVMFILQLLLLLLLHCEWRKETILFSS